MPSPGRITPRVAMPRQSVQIWAILHDLRVGATHSGSAIGRLTRDCEWMVAQRSEIREQRLLIGVG